MGSYPHALFGRTVEANSGDTLAVEEVTDYMKVHDAVLKTLNLSREANWRRLYEVTFGFNFYPRPIAEKIRMVGV